MTTTNEALEFLGIAESKGFLNANTVQARRTACNKLFDILDENQKTVEHVMANIDSIKSRFSNLNKDVAGATVDEYARRVMIVMNDFTEWSTDRSGWERKIAAKQNARPADGDKKPRAARVEVKQHTNGAEAKVNSDPEVRTVKFPIRPDFDVTITLPKAGLTVAEIKKLPYFLLPYASDWDPADIARGNSGGGAGLDPRLESPAH